MFTWWKKRREWKASHRVRVAHYLREMFVVEVKPAGSVLWETVTRSWAWSNGELPPDRSQPVMGLVEEMEAFASKLTAESYAAHVAREDKKHTEAVRAWEAYKNPPRAYDSKEILPR
jgi:hypothetical protein